MLRGTPRLRVALALAVALGGVAASAQPRVAVAVTAHEPELLPKSLAVLRELEMLARAHPGHTLVALPGTESSHGGPRAAHTAEGKRLLAEARAELDARHFKPALEKATRAVNLLSSGTLESDFAPLLDALALEAFLTHRSGDHAEAAALLQRLFALSLDYAPQFPRATEGFLALVKHERDAAAASPWSVLEVRAEPGSGFVWVDGLYRGVAPVRVEGLVPGEHYVTVLAPGTTPAQSTARAGPAGELSLRLELAPEAVELRRWLNAVTAAYPERPLAEVGPGFARWAHADVALLANLTARANGVELIAARAPVSGKGAAVARQVFDRSVSPNALARFVFAVLDAPGTFDVPPPAPEAAPQAAVQVPKGPDRTLGYVLLGSTAVTAAGGAALFVLAGRQRQDPATEPRAATTTAGAFLVSGVSLGLAGLTVYALLHPTEPPAQTPTATLSVLPLREGGQVALSGRF